MIGEMTYWWVTGDDAMPRSGERDVASAFMGEEEFRSFYERTARPLWSYLSRITGDRQQADDLLQEAYYRFYRAAGSYENEAHRRNSLFRIATNLARDLARRASRHEDVPLGDEEPRGLELESVASAPEERAAARTDLARAMKKIDPQQRELLWLAYVQGASHEEIAEIVGVKAISVRTLLLRARRRMASILLGQPEGRS